MCQLPCFCLGFGDDKRGMLRGKDVTLSIFITPMNGSKSVTSFFYRFFHVRRSPAWSWRLTRPKKMKNLAAFNPQEVKRAAVEKRKGVFLCSRTVRVKVKSKATTRNVLKIKGRVKAKPEKGTVCKIGK